MFRWWAHIWMPRHICLWMNTGASLAIISEAWQYQIPRWTFVGNDPFLFARHETLLVHYVLAGTKLSGFAQPRIPIGPLTGFCRAFHWQTNIKPHAICLKWDASSLVRYTLFLYLANLGQWPFSWPLRYWSEILLKPVFPCLICSYAGVSLANQNKTPSYLLGLRRVWPSLIHYSYI